MRLVADHGAVTTADAATHLGVSVATIRRDMAQLHSDGRVLRVQGGVVSTEMRYVAG